MKYVLISICMGMLAGSVLAAGPLVSTPPMGWNSYDSYGTYCHEQACYDNLDVFVKIFKPVGYEYFVIDGGWYIEYDFQPGTISPVRGKGHSVNMNEQGYFVPSKCYFPNGLKGITAECHKNGVKFGVHFLRGIPRKAVELNTPIQGTKYHAQDIANTNSFCIWNHHTYGVDMSKPGAQEYYDGWIQQLADWGVDFIKADDIVTYPAEIEAVQKAIEKCGRSIVLSLSPGSRVLGTEVGLYEKADMLRVTGDVWDCQDDIDMCFDSWLTWQYVPVREGFWFDMDMIPFGELRIMTPKRLPGEWVRKGAHRIDRFSIPQKQTFMTMRAMSASPLMMGGVLMTLDSNSLELLTNQKMIACNQNGVMGHLVRNAGGVQYWIVAEAGSNGKKGWIGIFNRTDQLKPSVSITVGRLGLDTAKTYRFHNIWDNQEVSLQEDTFDIKPNGCIFIQYDQVN